MHLIPEITMDYRRQACVSCNCPRKPEDRIIDLDEVIDFEGKLCICESCVIEAANLVGKLSLAAADRLKTQIQRRDEIIYALEQRIMAAERVLA